jgi:L-threonylcarbamoyladenylate synthase
MRAAALIGASLAAGKSLKTRLLSTNTAEEFRRAADAAAKLLKAGEVVAVPTETVYGLAANALNPAAVARIFEAKQRPSHNPIIVHVNGIAMAKTCVADWPEIGVRLAQAFWPGPLTLVLPRASVIPDIVTAGGQTVALRWPAHPLMEALIERCGFPLAAPSANPSNRLSPTTAEHVIRLLGGRIPLVIDGGPSKVGIESTVLDLTRSPPVVLRPGVLDVHALSKAADAPIRLQAQRVGPLNSPGQLARHYCPRGKLKVLAWSRSDELAGLIIKEGTQPEGVRSFRWVLPLRPAWVACSGCQTHQRHTRGYYMRNSTQLMILRLSSSLWNNRLPGQSGRV